MSNRKGTYADRVVITGELKSYQGNEIGRRNWLKNLNENKSKVVVQLVSQNPEMNETLERLLDFETVSIEFPWRDVPEQPKCNGDFDREAGVIRHDLHGIDACLVHRNEEQQSIYRRIKNLEKHLANLFDTTDEVVVEGSLVGSATEKER